MRSDGSNIVVLLFDQSEKNMLGRIVVKLKLKKK